MNISAIENSEKKSNYRKFIKGMSYIFLISNIISIILGILYISIGSYNLIWNIAGVVLIVTLIGNIVLVYLNVKYGNETNKSIDRMEYLYPAASIIGLMGLGIGNFIISNSYSSLPEDIPGMYAIVYACYFGTLTFGTVLSVLMVLTGDREEGSKTQKKLKIESEFRIIKITKGILTAVSLFILLIGGFFCYILLTRYNIKNIEIAVPSFSMFYAYITLSAAVLIVKLIGDRRNRRIGDTISVIGGIMFVIFMLPIILIPYSIKVSEKAFGEAFGKDWRGRIDRGGSEYFLKTPFSIPAYFLGIPSKGCTVKRDVLFYQGGEGVDKGIRLYFDAYMPSGDASKLPGKNSTLIRIHGGAWVTGDKGLANILQENKYFAEQGYVVFDIQYGLSTSSTFTLELGNPDYVKGNFNIDDMVRHIGIFTKYLGEHGNEYGANLNSVFISGGSAGGHLASAVALAISSGKYNNIFGSNIIIKGLIPFYPANGLARIGDLDGIHEFMEPKIMVEKNSPACLIFQGTHDGLVAPSVSKELKKSYEEKGNGKCAILWMPLAGHASDINFSGNYNQIFLYYMERFMYLYR